MLSTDQYVILNQLNDCVLIIDLDHTIVFANERFLELFHYRNEEILGRKCYEVLHQFHCPCTERGIPKEQCIHHQTFATGMSIEINHQYVGPEGDKKFLRISAAPIKDATGTSSSIICVIKDCSKEHDLEDALSRTLMENEALLHSTPYYLAYVDREMRVLKINKSMAKLIGKNEEEVKGHYCYETWGQYANDPDSKGKKKICDTCQVQYALSDGKTHRYERRLGDRFIEVSSSPVKNADGEIIGALECGLDITERLTAERELARSRSEWEKTFDSLNDIITIQDRKM